MAAVRDDVGRRGRDADKNNFFEKVTAAVRTSSRLGIYRSVFSRSKISPGFLLSAAIEFIVKSRKSAFKKRAFCRRTTVASDVS